MALRLIIQADVGQVVRDVLGTRLGRRCYLARLTGTPLPENSQSDGRWLWSHWLVANEQFRPTALERLRLDVAKAGRLRRWLWIWTGW